MTQMQKKTGVCRETSRGRTFQSSCLCSTESCNDGHKWRADAVKFLKKKNIYIYIWTMLKYSGEVSTFEVFFLMKIQAFWNVTLYRLVGGYKFATVYQRCKVS